MASHKFRIGQTVRYAPTGPSATASHGDYKVVRLLPPDAGQNQYRIKALSGMQERMARENELSLR